VSMTSACPSMDDDGNSGVLPEHQLMMIQLRLLNEADSELLWMFEVATLADDNFRYIDDETVFERTALPYNGKKHTSHVIIWWL